MRRTTTSLITAAASVALAAPALHAAPAVPPAASYADLFEPIPNAVERLKASDTEGEARFIEAQYGPPPTANPHHHHHHHHHHHSHHWYRSHGYVWLNGQWVLRPHHHHHHHHHHHQMPQ